MKSQASWFVLLLLVLPAIPAWPGVNENPIIQSYRQAVAANPNDVIAYYNLGLALYQQGNLDEAQRMLERSVNTNRGDQAAHAQVDGLACQILGSLYLSNGNNPGKAINVLEKSIKLMPNDFETLYMLGTAYMDDHRADKAIESLTLAAQAGQDKPDKRLDLYNTYLQLGRLYAQSKKNKEAVAVYQDALKLNPQGKDALANIALIYHQQNDPDHAIHYLEKLVKIDPHHFNANYLLGLNYFKKKRYDKMVAAYKRAIAIKPDLAEAHFNLGMAYYLQTRYDLAIASLKTVIKLNPKDAEAYNLLGQSQQLGIETHLQQGATYLAQEKLPEAISEFKKVLVIDPTQHKAQVYLQESRRKLAKLLDQYLDGADHYSKKGKLENAYQRYEQALQLDSTSLRAKQGLKKTKVKMAGFLGKQVEAGKAAQANGDYFEAIDHYQRALELKAGYKPAKTAMASLGKVLARKMTRDMAKAKADIAKHAYNRAVKKLRPLLSLAQNLNNKRKEKSVLLLLTKANAGRKEAIDTNLAKGKKAFNQGNTAEAKRYFERVLDYDSQQREANQYIMKLTGATSEAKVAAERIKATYYQGVDYYVNGKIEEAIAEWEKVVKLDPDNDDAKVNIKRARIKLEAIRKLTGEN